MQGADVRGRDREIAALTALLRRSAESGTGAVVTLTGEPGIGKSALVRETCRLAVRLGFRAGAGKADEVDQIALGAPLLLALRSGPAPLVPASLFNSLEPLYEKQIWLIDRIGVILENLAATGPLLIAIDDVQWADHLTRSALRVLPARLAASPVTWLLASRPDESGGLGEILDSSGAAVEVVRQELAPLTPSDVVRLAADRLGAAPSAAVRAMLATTGGNPFWVLQLLGDLQRHQSVEPDELMEANLWRTTHVRLRSLREDALWLVRMTAVWGRALDLEQAGRLAGAPLTLQQAAHDAAQSGLLNRSGSSVGFSHDLLRQAVYADLDPRLRVELHRICGYHLMAAADSALAGASHFQASAGPGDLEAVRVLLAAATECVEMVPDQGASLAQEALALLPPEHPEWFRTADACLDLLLLAQREREALVVADRVLASSAPTEARAEIQVKACRALWVMGECREIESRTVATLAAPGVTLVSAARLEALWALAATRTDSALRAREAAEEALSAGRRIGDAETQRIALLALTEANRDAGRHQAVYDWFVELRSVSATAYLAEEIRALQHLDRYDDAEALLSGARQQTEDDAGDVLPSVLYAQMWQDHNLARFGAAHMDALALLRAGQEGDNFTWEVNARIILAAIAIYRGRLPDARAWLGPAEHRDEAQDGLRVARLRATQAWLLAREGRLDQSRRILWPLLDAAANGGTAWPWSPPWMRTFALIGLAGGDEQLARLALELATRGAHLNPGVATMQGLALQVRGLVEHDIEALRDATDVLMAAPRPLLRATALADLGRAEQASGRPRQGQEHLDAAVSLFDALGVTPGGRRSDVSGGEVAQRFALPPAARATAGDPGEVGPVTATERRRTDLASLTATERRVAELVGAGHSSRSAAAELFVSTNTVNTHLKSIFHKLEVRSRVQLANVIRGRGLPHE